jgi:hypothetical protein
MGSLAAGILPARCCGRYLTGNLPPVCRISATWGSQFSRSGMSGMAAYRQRFQQVVLPLLAADGWASTTPDADLAQWSAKFGNPTIFVSLVEWAVRRL